MKLHTDEFVSHAGYLDRYRNGVAFHPIHALLATHPLRRLKHAGRVIVAGAEDRAVPRHLGFDAEPTVEDAVTAAERTHGAGCSVVCVN
jgi:predicted esterase